MKQKLKKGAATLAALLVWILIWHLLSSKVNVSFVLPKPLEVLARLIELCQTKEFYRTLATSLVRIVTGFAGGVLLGALFGYLSFRLSLLKVFIEPLMAMIRATPVASFILVVILWIERDGVPGFISFLMVLPIVFQNTLLGFEKRDRRLSEMAKVFRFSAWKTLCKIDLPQVLPFLFSSVKTGMGLAWKAGVAAEVLALPKVSIGLMIYNSKMYLETVDLYAWTLAIIVISVILEKLFSLLFAGRIGGANAVH